MTQTWHPLLRNDLSILKLRKRCSRQRSIFGTFIWRKTACAKNDLKVNFWLSLFFRIHGRALNWLIRTKVTLFKEQIGHPRGDSSVLWRTCSCEAVSSFGELWWRSLVRKTNWWIQGEQKGLFRVNLFRVHPSQFPRKKVSKKSFSLFSRMWILKIGSDNVVIGFSESRRINSPWAFKLWLGC